MKKTLLQIQPERQLFKQRPPKSVYNPAQQFKHRDRGIQSGRTNVK